VFFYHARSCSNVVKGRRDLDKNTFSYIIEKILRDKGLRVDKAILATTSAGAMASDPGRSPLSSAGHRLVASSLRSCLHPPVALCSN
jgi:hypothetical protein